MYNVTSLPSAPLMTSTLLVDALDAGQPAHQRVEERFESLFGRGDVLRSASIGDSPSTGESSGGLANPNGSIAAIIRGSARGRPEAPCPANRAGQEVQVSRPLPSRTPSC